ncbi:uncharacterized protein LOC143579793 [Bidens hawaiensis]|uniref:uncharacterized protein LOC143579793 n=1 Tax=Bidens hawaiensis TaxID=980011 RepID=UPI00404B0E12
MAETTTNEAKISIKVFVDKLKKRVVYAEADHTFVDILFSFMTLPLGTIVRVLEKHPDINLNTLGNLNNLYQSLKDFPECYFATEEGKFMLLNPRSLSYDHCGELKLEIDDTEPVRWFICRKCLSNNSSNSFSFSNKAKCRSCGEYITGLPLFKESNVCDGDGVFVSGIANFIVTDDLLVMPYTATESFRLLTDFGITDTSNLEERKLDMGREQVALRPLLLIYHACDINNQHEYYLYKCLFVKVYACR